jgi:ADP-heptose:LPS heptosyltransferase
MAIQSSHILICRNDNIGDVILTLPITAWLKRRFPSVRISFMCRAYAAAVVRECTTVDAVVEVESVMQDPVSYFRQSGIDTVIFAQPDKRLARAAFQARVPNRIGNARQKLYQMLFCNRRVRFSKRISPLHESQINFEFLRPFGLTSIPDLNEIAALYAFKPGHDEQMQALLQPYRFNLVLHTKSNGHGREWPPQHFLELAKLLARHPDIHLWTTGSANEGRWLEQHAADLLNMPNVSNVCGKLTLAQLTAFIGAADGLIASGTGPLHLSAALGQRTLGLFPPTRPMHPGRWAPVGPRARLLCMPTSCSGCAEIKAPSCACMEAIRPEMVEKVVLEWFEDARRMPPSSSAIPSPGALHEACAAPPVLKAPSAS